MIEKIGTEFYQGSDVVEIARRLLGKLIITNKNGILTGGLITETEAYAGAVDRASHAYNNRRTNRTEIMFQDGGLAYVYLCYGVHHLFNFVTNTEGSPHAVLLRGIYPIVGLKEMEKRRKMKFKQIGFSDGPGKATRALGITVKDNGTDLQSHQIWVEDYGIEIKQADITIGPRIGVQYAGEDALLPYRFLLVNPERFIGNKKP